MQQGFILLLELGRAARRLGLGLGDAVGERGQCAFDLHDAGRLPPGNGQRQQRQHAVGLDLEQALQHAATLAFGQALVDDQQACAAVVQLKVRVDLGGAVGDARADDDLAFEGLVQPIGGGGGSGG